MSKTLLEKVKTAMITQVKKAGAVHSHGSVSIEHGWGGGVPLPRELAEELNDERVNYIKESKVFKIAKFKLLEPNVRQLLIDKLKVDLAMYDINNSFPAKPDKLKQLEDVNKYGGSAIYSSPVGGIGVIGFGYPPTGVIGLTVEDLEAAHIAACADEMLGNNNE